MATETKMVNVTFGMFWQEYGRQSALVPAELIVEGDNEQTEENIIAYLKDHWDEYPLPDGDYIPESDELDEEFLEWHQPQKHRKMPTVCGNADRMKTQKTFLAVEGNSIPEIGDTVIPKVGDKVILAKCLTTRNNKNEISFCCFPLEYYPNGLPSFDKKVVSAAQSPLFGDLIPDRFCFHGYCGEIEAVTVYAHGIREVLSVERVNFKHNRPALYKIKVGKDLQPELE